MSSIDNTLRQDLYVLGEPEESYWQKITAVKDKKKKDRKVRPQGKFKILDQHRELKHSGALSGGYLHCIIAYTKPFRTSVGVCSIVVDCSVLSMEGMLACLSC